MSGHSKWSTIKRKKALVDAKRGQVWSKLVREINVAARTGGGDPGSNPRLRLALERARQSNVPKDAIARAVDKGRAGPGGENWEEITYEGYAPGGVAIVVECATDNHTRTVGEVRHVFTRFGGSLGGTGSVAWMFKKRGFIHVLKSAAAEDKLVELAIEQGADDVRDDVEVWTICTDAASMLAVKDALEKAGIAVEHAEIDNVPENRVPVDQHRAESVVKLISALEEIEDVQNVYANHDIDEAVVDGVGA